MIPQLSLAKPGQEQGKAGLSAAPGFLKIFSGQLAPTVVGEEGAVLSAKGAGKNGKASAAAETKGGSGGRVKKFALGTLGWAPDLCAPLQETAPNDAALSGPAATPILRQDGIQQIPVSDEATGASADSEIKGVPGASTLLLLEPQSFSESPGVPPPEQAKEPGTEALPGVPVLSSGASAEARQKQPANSMEILGKHPDLAAPANRSGSAEVDRPKAAAAGASLPDKATEQDAATTSDERENPAGVMPAPAQPARPRQAIEVPSGIVLSTPPAERVGSTASAQDGMGKKSAAPSSAGRSLGSKTTEVSSETVRSRDEQPATMQTDKPGAPQPRPANASSHDTPSVVAATTSTPGNPQGIPRPRDLSATGTANPWEHAVEAKAAEKPSGPSMNGSEAEVQINLRTAEMGRVEVRTAIHNTQVSTTVSVENSSARSAVVAELSQLPSALGHYRLELDSALVQVRGGDAGNTAGFGDSGQQRQQRQQSPLVTTVSEFHSVPDKAEDGREDTSLNVRA